MRDPGRQPERTRLAWRRTVLGFTAVALLTGRLAIVESGAGPALLAVAAALAGWLAVLALSWRRIVALTPPSDPARPLAAATPAPARRAVPLTACAALGFAGLGAVLVLSR
jgi:Domain of unknown function (DUF202)